MQSDSNLTANNATFIDCFAVYSGGAIHASSFTKISIKSSHFFNGSTDGIAGDIYA